MRPKPASTTTRIEQRHGPKRTTVTQTARSQIVGPTLGREYKHMKKGLGFQVLRPEGLMRNMRRSQASTTTSAAKRARSQIAFVACLCLFPPGLWKQSGSRARFVVFTRGAAHKARKIQRHIYADKRIVTVCGWRRVESMPSPFEFLARVGGGIFKRNPLQRRICDRRAAPSFP